MRTLGVALIAGLSLGLLSSAANADVIKTFSVTGVFANGSALSGTLSVDVTAGSVTNASLMTTAPLADVYTMIASQGYSSTFDDYFVQVDDSTSIHDVNLGFATTSLVGYAGGALYSATFPSPNNFATCLDHTYNLVSGSVLPVPLPSSAPMVAAGLVIVGIVGYGSKRRKEAAASSDVSSV